MGLLQILLAWGPKANVYDMELFKQFAEFHEKLNSHNSVMQSVLKAVRKKLFDKHENTNWAGYFDSLQAGITSDPRSIARQYLNHFAFENNGDLSQFKKKDAMFLTKDMINQIEAKVQVYLSQDGLKSVKNETMTQSLYQQICEEVDL